MTRPVQIALLCLLTLLLGYVAYRNLWPANAASRVSSVNESFVPLPVENPALRLDLLDRLKEFEYQGPRRNIFSATPLTLSVPAFDPAPAVPAPRGPRNSSSPPALVVPAMFFGHVTDAQTGSRRAFFSEGEEVHIIGVGEILLERFRLLQIGDSSAELQEISSGRRTTLIMEEPRGG